MVTRKAFKRGDIVEIPLDEVVGREQRGRRRVMVLSPEEFNAITGLAWVAPITQGGGFARNHGLAVSITGTGLDTQGVVLWYQMTAHDLHERKARFIEAAPQFLVDDVLAHARVLLEN